MPLHGTAEIQVLESPVTSVVGRYLPNSLLRQRHCKCTNSIQWRMLTASSNIVYDIGETK